ncbi:hypothetical protein P3T39_005288 [Kitasatospora sp. GP82]|nr:hypothetical protein [Kitasatospora sp. GP82]
MRKFLICGTVLAGLVAVVAHNLPDIKRYLRIRRM